MAAWRGLSGSAFLKKRIVVAAAEHGGWGALGWGGGGWGYKLLTVVYTSAFCTHLFPQPQPTPPHPGPIQSTGFCDGASHQRRDLYRCSPYDTGVFVLQTTKGAAKWKLPDAFERDVRAAFAACIPSAAAVERQRRQRGASEVDHWGVGPAADAAAGGSGKGGGKASGKAGGSASAKKKVKKTAAKATAKKRLREGDGGAASAAGGAKQQEAQAAGKQKKRKKVNGGGQVEGQKG